jgi:uncharacterized protein
LLLVVLPAYFFLEAAEIPFLAGRVNDVAGLLSNTTHAELESLLKAHEDSTTNQVVVLIVPSLDGEVLEEFSIKVAEMWKLGQRGRDNGALLLVARDDRKVRIEVGRGLEGSLTDARCGWIIRKEIVPRFRDGEYDAGVRAGVNAILGVIRGEYTAEAPASGMDDLAGRITGFVVFLIVVGVFTIIGLFAKGFVGWFLYVFLIPFWSTFPSATIGEGPGVAMLAAYLICFPILKMWFRSNRHGMKWRERMFKGGMLGSTFMGGVSRGGSWSSSGGGGFSGGGGSFGGGGSSGSW